MTTIITDTEIKISICVNSDQDATSFQSHDVMLYIMGIKKDKKLIPRQGKLDFITRFNLGDLATRIQSYLTDVYG